MFKTKNRRPLADIVHQKLNNGHKILPFPQVVGRLIAALKNPDANATGLARIIESDPALTVRLLRMANSPVYGNSHIVQSVGRATTVLGFDPLKKIALTFAASSLFSDGSDANKNRELVWNHSLGCACTARELAKFVQSVNPEDAFLAGIFHDVGKLFFYDTIPAEYASLDESFNGKSLTDRETALLGATHEEVGLKLVTAWQLSEKMMVAVGFHHRPDQAIAHRDIASLIHLADVLAKQAGIGSPADEYIEIGREAIDYLMLKDEAIAIVMEHASKEFEATKRACSN